MFYFPVMTAREHRPTVALAAPHPAAAAAGRAAVARGGNAVDAAVAAAMALTVAYPHMCSVGGDLFALVRRPDGSVVGVNASGAHGSAVTATPDAGPGHRSALGDGARRGVGLGERCSSSADRCRPRTCCCPPSALAEDGVRVSAGLAAGIDKLVAAGTAGSHLLRLLDGSRSEGDLLRQPALAQTLRTLADEGLSSLYDGTVGDRLASGLRDLDVPVTREDLRAHRPVVEEPWTVATQDDAGVHRRRRTPRATCCSPCSVPASASAAFPTSTSRPWSLLFARAEECRLAELADPRYLTSRQARAAGARTVS